MPNIPPTMLVLVGEQRIPNAVPVKQFPHGTIKSVEMIYSEFTKRPAEHFKAWLGTQGIKVIERPDLLPVREPNDFQALLGLVGRILANYSQGEVLVNLTGGTKIMSLAAAEVSRKYSSPTIYVDTETNSFWWVHPQTSREPLKVKFGVEEFFILHGQPWKPSHAPSDEDQAVARTLGARYEQLESLLRRLKISPHGSALALRPSPVEADFLTRCQTAGLIKPAHRHAAGVTGSSIWRLQRGRFFEHNHWHECLAYAACCDAGFDDVQWQIPLAGTPTDLDVAATRGPVMLICSCKSGGFKNSHLDELDAQARRVGGLFCRKAIILVESIAFQRRKDTKAVAQARQSLESRARNLGVRPFYWTDYALLDQKMKQFLDEAGH